MEEEILDLINQLSPIERKILPYLELKDTEKISEKAELDETAVKRALQFLSNKKIIKIEQKKDKFVDLEKNGVVYLKNGMPERKLLHFIIENNEIGINELKSKCGLNEQEFNVALGILKRRSLISIENGKIILTSKNGSALNKSLEEKFLEALPMEYSKLNQEQKNIIKELETRKEIVSIKEKSLITFEIIDLGRKIIKPEILKEISSLNLIESLTPAMIKTGGWKGKKFRIYDVESKVPEIYAGKGQFYYNFLKEVRKKLIAMGFEEMEGNLIVSEFWNFDALFQPQFHVAREWTDNYNVKNKLKLEKIENRIISNVKNIHEKKWNYKWSLNKAMNYILRPQGTIMSAKTIASNPKNPGRYFSIARCFRPDVIDAKHLSEFNQVEGIIVADKLTFTNLLDILRTFAKEIAGIKNDKDIRFQSDYYPFTEPSIELDIKHPLFGWIEIGGAGIFRKEVVESLLGKNVTVLAWGLGIDRLAMAKLDIKDIRHLFTDDLKILREK
ncbi:phenylalanine--tRNA ligase subunit alpha [Candidatus Pacearchaeota archaeon CG_4_9_14_3_um_filter_31_7]|nr:MAG: hypothetical protein AUJ10_01800 [Candidatus Pacearchaeota archaeon CG1_02_31_27]PIZ80721.1 MAG: phenylalanine--tRNA ligase subunit alpha [Candidatus Pacearchaeota archaeon CG_4_10_14_0_2_um_filter_31_10]PJA70910.1 MAG: phenylalanine--tRNA ligase subunit alpha [Candidatus Pacearchaeota archaeon CG_4_9_14_3_um_filter_31_7]